MKILPSLTERIIMQIDIMERPGLNNLISRTVLTTVRGIFYIPQRL